METRIVRKTTYASKGPEVALRHTWDYKNSDVLRMLRETQSKLHTWNFDPIPSESRNWPDASSTCRELSDASLHCQRAHEKDQQKGHIYIRRFLTASWIIKYFAQCLSETIKTIHEVIVRVANLPLNSKPKSTMGHHLGLSFASWEDKGHVDLLSQSTAFRPLHCEISGARHCQHEQAAGQSPQIISRRSKCRDDLDPEKLDWLVWLSHNWTWHFAMNRISD